MGYRNKHCRKHTPDDFVPRYIVRNGATTNVVFKCFYCTPGHNPHQHDFIGWPAPNYHAESCQMPTPRDVVPWLPKPYLGANTTPIQLADEGFTDASVVFDDDVSGKVTAVATFDQADENVINVHFDTSFPTFQDPPKELKFTLFASGGSERHAVCRGILVVLPGAPYSS